MSNPIGPGGPQDPYDKYQRYRVEPADKDKHEEERKKFEEEPPQKPVPTSSFLLAMLHKMVNYLLRLAGQGASEASEKEVRENLLLLKAAFEALKIEDLSQDVEFLNQFSEIWHNALENSMRFKRDHPFIPSFRSFTKKIQNYPEGEEHSLGYYLTEYTGEKWLPFPYMDLIQTIYRQYQEDPISSPLAQWIQEIDGLIASIS